MAWVDVANIIAPVATRLATPRTIWGQSFDGSENIADTLFLCQKTTAGVNTSSARIRFNGFASNQQPVQGPSIEGININAYGVKRLAIFQHQQGGYTEEYEREVMSIMPNGYVGFGTTDPKKRVHIVGDIYVTGKIISEGGIENVSQSTISQQLMGGGGIKPSISTSCNNSKKGGLQHELDRYKGSWVVAKNARDCRLESEFCNRTLYNCQCNFKRTSGEHRAFCGFLHRLERRSKIRRYANCSRLQYSQNVYEALAGRQWLVRLGKSCFNLGYSYNGSDKESIAGIAIRKGVAA